MKVYVVLKNADFTEGRGPMILDRVFKVEDAAVKYVMSQRGIFGGPQFEQSYSKPGERHFNGYHIKISPVLDEDYQVRENELIAERKKLEARLLEIDDDLGEIRR